MQTLLAFAFEHDVPEGRLRAGRDRVERWYRSRWGHPVEQSAGDSRRGLTVWDRADEECRWPSWSAAAGEVAATLQVPLGYQRLIGEQHLATAPLALARHLQTVPEDVLRLTAPFVLAHLDLNRPRLTLLTDGMGIGRLYQLRTAAGRFWSNRPVAALLFAGVRAEADELAWRQLAACDWAMGDRTGYRGVTAVGPATRVVCDQGGHRESSLDVLAHWAGSRREPLGAGRIEETADALVGSVRAVARLWPQVPTLGLSGGRDSRLVAAAFVAAGLEVKLKTYGGAAGEEETARRLVAQLPHPLPHQVTDRRPASPGQPTSGGYERARQWHDLTEGLRPALYLRSTPPRQLLRQRPPLVCGVGGEFGHAPGYPDDVQRLERLPLARRMAAFGDSLEAKIVLPRGLAEHSVTAVQERVRQLLGQAADSGVTDAKALDWFYAEERLRRWGLAGESFGRVLPLLTPEFVSAAFGLSTAQSLDSALHSALIAALVPQWRDVPFYSATLKERQSVPRRRLWQEPDVGLLSGVIAGDGDWGDAFDVPRVRSVWQAALAGRAAARDELLLQRVIWRAAFSDHLAAVNGTGPGERPMAPLTRVSHATSRRISPLRTLAMHANDVPMARRLARSPLGRQLRRRLGV